MSICIDARVLQTVTKDAGIGIYGKFLIKNLLKLDLNQEYTFIKLGNYPWENKDIKSDKINFYNVYRPKKPMRFHTIYDYFLLNRTSFNNKIKVIHMLHPSSFRIKGVKNIVTCHDLIPLRYPDIYLRKYDIHKMYKIKLDNLSKCDKIICVSQSVKQDIIDLLRIDEDKLVVIYNGVDPLFITTPVEKDRKNTLSSYGINKNYILHVGGIDYRKNVISAVKGFLKSDDLHKDFQMVIVGNNYGKEFNEINNLMIKYNKQKLFIFTGIIPRLDLFYIYHGATAFIYPSMYEGFGLPPLEAMACDIPVITSNTTSLPEVVGDAAIKVNPLDIDEITEALNIIIFNKDIRSKLIDRGKQQILYYQWRENATKTLDLYRKLM